MEHEIESVSRTAVFLIPVERLKEQARERAVWLK